MARDGTQPRTTRSLGLTGPTFTLLVAGMALVVLRRRQHVATAPSDPTAEPVTESSPEQVLQAVVLEQKRPPGRLPRFATGAFTGVMLGIMLGVVAVGLVSMASPDVRSTLIVGTGLKEAPAPGGEYVARVLSQEMNPNLVYADAEVATLFAMLPEEPEEAPVISSPVEQDLQDRAELVFVVFGVLTAASWGLVMWGLNAASPRAREAGVE